MAAGFMQHKAGECVQVLSAGSAPKESINPIAVQVMAEIGIDISSSQPRILTDSAVEESDFVITMGCGDACKFYPGKRYEDWKLDDPAGQSLEKVRQIRDQIEVRVTQLLSEIL
jgi:arsenate reductase